MDVVNDDAKGNFRRIEVLTGPVRRRRWSAEDKGRIVAASLQTGATVTEVARRWHVCPQQVWGWRRDARDGHFALPAGVGATTAMPPFVPIVTALPRVGGAVAGEVARQDRTRRATAATSIEIRLADAVVQVALGTDGALLTDVLRAVRASA